jgi:hypothetical protein
MTQLFPPDVCRTKIAGVMMGAKTKEGIPVRQLYLAELKKKDIRGLTLVREPDNKYDSNAIAIHADYGSGDIHLGYIQNRVRICLDCSKEFARVDPQVEVCPDCGGTLAREGLASTLARFIDQGIEYKARILDFTGGGELKCNGCNILIERVL